MAKKSIDELRTEIRSLDQRPLRSLEGQAADPVSAEELLAIEQLKTRLMERIDAAAVMGEVAARNGNWAEYDRQLAVIERTHRLLKELATFVWSELTTITKH